MPATCVPLSVLAAATPATRVAWLQAGVGGLFALGTPVFGSNARLVVLTSLAVRSGCVPSTPVSMTAIVVRHEVPTSYSHPAKAETTVSAYWEPTEGSFGLRLAE